MIKLTIDNQQVTVQLGSTILEAANSVGIEIPTMCYLKECTPSTSCLICVVERQDSRALVPACATRAAGGMKIHTDSDRVRKARTIALELLLSDHTGDCRGPCELTCPCGVDIPVMIRQIIAGDNAAAIRTIKKDMAFPATLARTCAAPCEKGCRRAHIDQPVAICSLERYVADIDLSSETPYLPQCQPSSNKNVAIIGAGPAGLSAAYFLQLSGTQCTVFDKNQRPAGRLRSAETGASDLNDIIDAEIAIVQKMGIQLRTHTEIGKTISLGDLRKGFDAVLVTTGRIDDASDTFSLEINDSKIAIEPATFVTSLPGVFAAGSATRKTSAPVRSCADGKLSAACIAQFLGGRKVTGQVKPFNSFMGKLTEDELKIFLDNANKAQKFEPDPNTGFTSEQAHQQASRCLRCDCRKKENCKLRDYSQTHHARFSHYKDHRRQFIQDATSDEIVFEPGKCIDCGLCIQIAQFNAESPALAFTNRGFNVRVAVPFNQSIAKALKRSAKKCAKACPTAALALK